jgi:hypothetical protein
VHSDEWLNVRIDVNTAFVTSKNPIYGSLQENVAFTTCLVLF